jgi:lipopolysaccharide export system protein LptA
MSRRPAELLLLPFLVAFAGAADARSSDRNQPMELLSSTNSCTLGDSGTCVLTGNVRITQGTLDITAAKATIYRGGGEVSRAVLSGAPVVLKQTMDDGTPMTARASGVDYNLRTEVVVFTGDVNLQQPRGSMSGARVVYNLKTGTVESGGGEGDGRVRMTILPKKAAPAPQAEDQDKGTP